MIVEIALGILLAGLMLMVGIAVVVLIIKWLAEILAYVACVGSLLGLSHFFGGWGLALWFALIIGFLVIAEILNPSERKTTEARGEFEHG